MIQREMAMGKITQNALIILVFIKMIFLMGLDRSLLNRNVYTVNFKMDYYKVKEKSGVKELLLRVFLTKDKEFKADL